MLNTKSSLPARRRVGPAEGRISICISGWGPVPAIECWRRRQHVQSTVNVLSGKELPNLRFPNRSGLVIPRNTPEASIRNVCGMPSTAYASCVVLPLSIPIQPAIGRFAVNAATVAASSYVTDRNSTLLSRNWSDSLFRCGICSTQGAHYVAQNSSTTACPHSAGQVATAPAGAFIN